LSSLDVELRESMYKMAAHVIKGIDLDKLARVARKQAKGDSSKIETIKKVQTLITDESVLSTDRIPEEKACELLE
jgi:hypothetical protein